MTFVKKPFFGLCGISKFQEASEFPVEELKPEALLSSAQRVPNPAPFHLSERSRGICTELVLYFLFLLIATRGFHPILENNPEILLSLIPRSLVFDFSQSEQLVCTLLTFIKINYTVITSCCPHLVLHTTCETRPDFEFMPCIFKIQLVFQGQRIEFWEWLERSSVC